MEDYCRAMADAKLSSRLGSRDTCFYEKERFRDFVNRDIDIRDLSQHMANFSQSADVAQALHTIRAELQLGIAQKLGSAGSILQIGSFYDGSKTGRLNEMDCLYVVSEADVVIEQINSARGHFRVRVNGSMVTPRESNKKLIDAMKEILSEMTLPDGWTHGGYCSRGFSGVRCNGPAVTAMFCNKDEMHISLDVSIAFPLTERHQKVPNFPEQLSEHCQSLTRTVKYIQSEVLQTAISPADLHLIGNLIDNTWQPTTALAEAEILRVLETGCSVKGSVEVCKAISSKQQTWYEQTNTLPERLTQEHNEVIESLHNSLRTNEDGKIPSTDKLNTNMAFQHIWLSSTERKDYKEVLKADASINTAAIKHIVLRTALQMKGAFSGHNKTDRDCLVRTVFEELSDPGSMYTPHAILRGVQLAKFSLSVTLSPFKDDVARDLQEQCKLILEQGLRKVYT